MKREILKREPKLKLQAVYTPKFPLNQFVDTIWVGKINRLELQGEHHAALFTELIFNYGNQFQIEGQNTAHFIHGDYHHIISGLKTEPFQTTVSGMYHNIGLILKPFCYGNLIQKLGTQPMHDLSDILYEYAFQPEKPEFKRAEPHLLQFFKGLPIDPDLAKFEKQISATFLQKKALRHFNQSLPITQKSFIQKFKKHYVLTPSQYVKLRQVNYVIQQLPRSKKISLTQLGLEAGFYDQSHFIRVFKKFCGITPRQFLQMKKC